MEPAIRYAKASDGAGIAFWELGEGPPLVAMPATPFTHVQLEWRIPESRGWLEALLPGHRLVRYDARGFGLSDREVSDFTLPAQCLDLDAVANALGLDRFALYAPGDSGMAAIQYAATRPERVSHLVLWCSWARRADVSAHVRTQTLQSLVEGDWEIYTETTARVLLGWSEDEAARRFAAFYREAADPKIILKLLPVVHASDATEYLSGVSCPALVIHRTGLPAVATDVARRMAAEIPDARLVLLEGSSPLPFLDDMDEIADTVHQFLGDAAVKRAEKREGSAPVTILLTDMAGSTAMTQQIGDAAHVDVLRAHNEIVRRCLSSHGGREIKHTGDGIMASFTSASGALECAMTIQQSLAEYASEHPDVNLHVRVGVNAGEPVAEDGDYFGTAVQLAARICDLAKPGQILVSGVVRDLVAGKKFLFADCGEITPRGFEDAVRLYEAHW
jgi:class 3 adenylate cyclase